jgi:hypothetical protein
VATRHSGQVGQSPTGFEPHSFGGRGGFPVLHVILALIHATYQFANNVKKTELHVTEPHTNIFYLKKRDFTFI